MYHVHMCSVRCRYARVYFLFSCQQQIFSFFFFNDTATTEIYTLSLHDALPIFPIYDPSTAAPDGSGGFTHQQVSCNGVLNRSEEHTSELQSPCNLVCRLLLEKKKKNRNCSLIPSTLSSSTS